MILSSTYGDELYKNPEITSRSMIDEGGSGQCRDPK